MNIRKLQTKKVHKIGPSIDSTLVELLTHNPKIQGSNPAGTGMDKMAGKKEIFDNFTSLLNVQNTLAYYMCLKSHTHNQGILTEGKGLVWMTS